MTKKRMRFTPGIVMGRFMFGRIERQKRGEREKKEGERDRESSFFFRYYISH
jgi:hypothetical protein